jgi:rhodanese-related sulfurtransferase
MVLVDVRTKPEYDARHIEGAVLHDIMDIMKGIFPRVAKDEEIVLYCESGNRSMMAKSLLEQAGFTNVTDAGGIDDAIKISSITV